MFVMCRYIAVVGNIEIAHVNIFVSAQKGQVEKNSV